MGTIASFLTGCLIAIIAMDSLVVAAAWNPVRSNLDRGFVVERLRKEDRSIGRPSIPAPSLTRERVSETDRSKALWGWRLMFDTGALAEAGSKTKPGPQFSPVGPVAPQIINEAPDGCEPVFGPFAAPFLTQILGRCIT